MSLDGRTIGLVEDDPIMGESLVQRLTIEGATVRWWQTGREAAEALPRSATDIVVCDIRLPDMTGEEVFRGLADTRETPPFLFITAHGDIDQAVRLMRAGAGDYLTKPFVMEAFLDRVSGLVREVAPAGGTGTLGISPAIRQIEATLRRIAKTRATVLLQGETGTGKEVAARFVHMASDQADKPFIAVNCAAIPQDLLESELFGHERGAFTGADKRHLGYAERAGTGTLFLDEVGELPDRLQAKLLRLLEERSFGRLGSELVLPFKARVIAATNRSLERAVADGRFRDDLYYRLAVVAIDMPPLRERRDDIPWLIDMFFEAAAESGGSALKGVSSLTVEAALAHGWPGNIRELRNRIERAVALTQGDWLMPSDVFPQRSGSPNLPSVDDGSLAAARDAAEARRIESALKETSGHIGEAAKLLGISRTTLWERMRRRTPH
ncbi:MAG: sigma-54-dependent Fis family transcriptional regulator [Rhizobiales bacterium]|nr:sigma-54-dependent Fis family transcriptional regulator [Hyphomicrobiales bacterium]